MFVLVEAHNKAYEPLAQITLHQNKVKYCDKHGYKIHYTDDLGEKASGGLKQYVGLPPVPEDQCPGGWGKIFLMKEAMDKYPNESWLFNIDTDAMITNMDVKLEDVLGKIADPNTHVVIPVDCNGINCGVMFVRISPIGRAFLDTIIAGMPLYRHWYMFENQLIQDLIIGTHLEEDGIHNNGSFWGRVIRVAPQRLFNSYDYKNLPKLKNRPHFKDILGNDGQWKEGDFVIQWPSTDLDFRINASKSLLSTISI